MLSQEDKYISSAFVCTAVYENKADKAIKEYNDNHDSSHSEDIFKKMIKPMLILGNYDKTLDNLSRIIFRGHCFGAIVISELENLLERDLSAQFNEIQCKKLLSAPQALISSPALQLDNYPKHFQTTAIVNNSDRTITNEQYCGNRLKEDLSVLAGFRKDDLISLDVRDIFDKQELPQTPDIKTAEIKRDNVHLFICNRASLPDSYTELKGRIEKRIGSVKEDDKSYEKNYIKQLKKNISGHEYFFLPDELKSNFKKAFTHIRIREIHKKIHNTQEFKNDGLQMGKTGNSQTETVSDAHRPTEHLNTKLAILQKRQAKEK